MQYISKKIPPELDGKDVKTVLIRSMGVSSGLVSRVKLREKGILLNGERVFTNTVCRSGDLLLFDISDEPSDKKIKKIPYPLDVVYEDEHLMVINKPSGMVVYASENADGPCTLANALAYYFDNEYLNLHIVNRLDRGTTGLMIVAKNSFCHEMLRKNMHTDAFCREYLAVTEGVPSPESGEISLPIARDENSLIKRRISDTGLKSLTLYETAEKHPPYALVRLRLMTGRTHQIRLHLSAIGCPLVGDFLYGREDKSLISRPALHSCFMSFVHPVTGERLEFFREIPDDMISLIK